MLAALVNILAVPAARETALTPAPPDNTWLHNWQNLIVDTSGPCGVNRETNCWCSSNYQGDDCNDTPDTGGTYNKFEDCTITFALPVDLHVPVFSVEKYAAKSFPCELKPNNYDAPAYKNNWCQNNCKRFGACYPYHNQNLAYTGTRGWGDRVFMDHHGWNKPKDTDHYSGELGAIVDGMNGVQTESGDIDGKKATRMAWRSDWNGEGHGFKICAVNPWVDPGGKPPQGGGFPGGTVPPDNQACPCGTNPSGDAPAGTHESERASGDNCFTNPMWPCDRDEAEEEQFWDSVDVVNSPGVPCEYNNNRPHGPCRGPDSVSDETGSKYKLSKGLNKSNVVTEWELDARASLTRSSAKASVMCCVCQGGWLDGYDPAGDMATETLLDGEYTRPDCIHAVKKIAGANAASMDDTATDEVAGSCWAESNAHYSPKGWTANSTRQACLLGN